MNLLPELSEYIGTLLPDFELIPDERKQILNRLSVYIQDRISKGKSSKIIFICTHNSRRSHMSQLWAQTAAYYYGVDKIECFSGGTEATAFNPRSVKALRKAGFDIIKGDTTANPKYRVQYATNVEPVLCFSKRIEDQPNPKTDFVAVMTCSDADEACPVVHGSSLRISLPYSDPKEADDTPEEDERYDERCRQIATEMFYAFSQV